MKYKKIVLKARFDVIPKLSDFELLDQEVSEDLKENEFLYETLYVSVDPYTRYFMDWFKVGDTITGYQLARVTKSRNTKYPSGTMLTLEGGWTTGGKSEGNDVFYVSNDIPGNVTQSAALGLIGKPGLTAYYGLLEVCKPSLGETVFISAAAGSVGNIVGQLSKMKGCRVVGSCGSEEKIQFLKSTVGFDDAFNYKTATTYVEEIKRVAPEGIDCYFDNVGGELSTAVIRQMNRSGRICVCGSMSSYNSDGNMKAGIIQPSMLQKCLKMEGISIFSVMDKYDEWLDSLRIWTEEGKLKSYEDVTVGFHRLPETFIGMMAGKNVGKALVKV